MGINPQLQNKLLQILLDIEFDIQYYDFFRKLQKEKENISEVQHYSLSKVIEHVFPGALFFKEENFYRKQITCGKGKMWIHIHILGSSVEIGLYLVIKNSSIAGGTFPDLAFKTAYFRDDFFSFDPALPRLPFCGKKMFENILEFAMDYCFRVKKMVLADALFFE
ncbi:hypothetical protein KAJ27_13340 [bacterium]|nr:hypothetical protein [bacterium]